MKIATGSVFDEFGGVSQHIFGIEKYSLHDVKVFPSRLTREVLKRLNGAWFYKKIITKKGLKGFDVVHSHVDPWFINLGLTSSRNGSSRWIHTYHMFYCEEDYLEGLQWWRKMVNRTLVEVASKADVRISVSRWLHNYLDDVYSIKTEFIPNGVDLESCRNANPDEFYEKSGLKDFVLYIGGLDSRKDPQSFVQLAAASPDMQFVMIGRYLDRSSFAKMIGMTIPRNLTLMGEMRHADALNAISASRLFVMTSKREGFPTVLLEAMALGKPVVAPRVFGCKEIVCNSEYGFLYQPDSLDDLAEKTRQALDSGEVGRKAREYVKQNYDWRVIIKKIDAIYESLG